MCIVKYYNHREENVYQQLVFWPENGYFLFLKNTCTDEKIEIVPYKSFFKIRLHIKRFLKWLYNIFVNKILSNNRERIPSKEHRIAVHYQEGVDLTRRSDLFWHPLSQIKSDNVIIYFDRSSSHLVTKEHIKQIDDMGMLWVVIEYIKMMPFICWKLVWQPYSRRGNKGNAMLNFLAKQKDGFMI